MKDKATGALILLIIIIGILGYAALIFAGIAVCFCLCKFLYDLFWKIYESIYFNSKKFLDLKNSIENNTKNYNELNEHIEYLKTICIEDTTPVQQGHASYYDNSFYNYKKPELKHFSNEKIHHCSLSVCRNAKLEPFKYICKYFNIDINEDSIEKFGNLLNDFAAIEEGKKILKNERDMILEKIKNDVPFLIIKYRKQKLMKNLGFTDINVDNTYFPKYTFRYVSPGGNSTMVCDVVMSINNLEEFLQYLNEKISYKLSAVRQRTLMTRILREKIKERDSFTCQNCGLSVKDEPNLLLEIDHIIPISKGGLTTEDNLQTLCWRCNRSKSNKLIDSDLNKQN